MAAEIVRLTASTALFQAFQSAVLSRCTWLQCFVGHQSLGWGELDSGRAAVRQSLEFVASRFTIAERAQHGASYSEGTLLLDATHHHGEVASFTDHADAQRIDALLYALRHLLRQALLDLQAAREGVNNARNFAEPNHFFPGR